MPFVAQRAFGWEPVEITEEWGLRDIKSGMAYPLCNSVQCADCGVLFLDIRFTDSEMASIYSGYREEEYVELRERFEPGYRARNRVILEGHDYTWKIEDFLSAHLPRAPKVLDWGGDTGLNTPFKSRCSQLHIYDISAKPVVDGASRVNLDTVQSTRYDLIVISNVLEHLPFPSDTLSEIRLAMSADTVLYVEVPHEELMIINPGSKNLAEKKKHWHEHVNFFTRESLEFLLLGCGLKTIDIKTMDVSSGGRAGHVYCLTCKRTSDTIGRQQVYEAPTSPG